MQIDILTIKNTTGAELKYSSSESMEIGNFSGLELKGMVSLDVTVRNAGHKFVAEGLLKTTLQFVCSRCLAPVERIMELPILEVFIEGDDNEQNEDETWNFKDNIIDFDGAIRSTIILDIPAKVLCTDECKGLCPICGHNLNESDCGCDRRKIDTRFAKLSDLFDM